MISATHRTQQRPLRPKNMDPVYSTYLSTLFTVKGGSFHPVPGDLSTLFTVKGGSYTIGSGVIVLGGTRTSPILWTFILVARPYWRNYSRSSPNLMSFLFVLVRSTSSTAWANCRFRRGSHRLRIGRRPPRLPPPDPESTWISHSVTENQ